jgi:hypothetical protein
MKVLKVKVSKCIYKEIEATIKARNAAAMEKNRRGLRRADGSPWPEDKSVAFFIAFATMEALQGQKQLLKRDLESLQETEK